MAFRTYALFSLLDNVRKLVTTKTPVSLGLIFGCMFCFIRFTFWFLILPFLFCKKYNIVCVNIFVATFLFIFL